MAVIFLVLIYENWSTETEYNEKGIVVDDVDEWMMGSIAHGLQCYIISEVGNIGEGTRATLGRIEGGPVEGVR